ncbi:MAG TPA: phosphatase PAP2 family protein [Thermoanaerobaculia bacterium]
MSIAAEKRIDAGGLSLERKRRYAAAAFISLLILSVFWPSPIVSANRLWLHADLAIDELSFLGREAPSWDVVFWFIAGLLLLMICQTADQRATLETPRRILRELRFAPRLARGALLGLAFGAVVTAIVWLAFDSVILASAEMARVKPVEDVNRLINRLSGGMNPVMIVVFFLVAGIAYLERRWVAYAIGMAMSGLAAGILVQIIKHLVGRARPELWLGPSHYAPGTATSFPSGHTVGAFALAGVLIFGSKSVTLRIVALVLAIAAGTARIISFRHWASDVTASAAIGLVTAWVCVELVGARKDLADSEIRET